MGIHHSVEGKGNTIYEALNSLSSKLKNTKLRYKDIEKERIYYIVYNNKSKSTIKFKIKNNNVVGYIKK